MVSKPLLKLCIVGLIYSVGIVNGFTSNVTTNLNNKSLTQTKENNTNKTKINKKQRAASHNIFNSVRNNIYEELAKDTKKRSKTQPHIASYLPANLPRQLIICMENALKNNKQIEEAQKEILATHEQHNIDRAALMPRITAENSTSSSRDYFNKPEKMQDSKETDVTKRQYDYKKSSRLENTTTLSVRYNIFHGGADIANLESTDKSIEAKWKNYDATIQKVLQEVAQNYFAIFGKQEEIKNIKALLKAREETQRVAEEMLKAGTAKELDVDQANTGCSEAQLRLDTAQAEEQIYRTNLKQLTGVEVKEKLEAPDKLFDKKFTKTEALDIAIKNNPQIIAVIAEHAAAKAKLSVPNGEFLPSVDLVASGSRRFMRNRYYDVNDSIHYRNSDKRTIYEPSVALQLSWPIFNGMSSFSKKVQQAYNVAKVSVTKSKVYTEIEKELSTVLEKLDLAEKNINEARKMIHFQNNVLKSTKDEHSAGTKLMKDVLDAQQKLFDCHSTLTNAIRDRYINQCNLMGLLGWFNPSDLKLEGLKFDYIKEYYRQIKRFIPTWEEMGVENNNITTIRNNTNKALINNNKSRIQKI